MNRVLSFWDRVCSDIHDIRYMIHDVFVYRVPNSAMYTVEINNFWINYQKLNNDSLQLHGW